MFRADSHFVIFFLVILDISMNTFSGSLPTTIGGLAALETLLAEDAGLVGPIPAEFESMAALRTFKGTLNLFTGAIPTYFGTMAALETLDISDNSFDIGTFPADLLASTSLKTIILARNEMSGPLPDAGTGGPQIEYLDVSAAGLSGPLPASLGDHTSMTTLNLNDNFFTGPLPSELSDFDNLRELLLNQNQLTGPIPTKLSATLENLSLNGNAFTGDIPTDLQNLEGLITLDLGNLLKLTEGGLVPEIAVLPNLANLDMSNSQRTGAVPYDYFFLSNLQTLNVSSNQLSGGVPAFLDGVWQNLTTIDMSNNQLLGGQLPSEVANLANLGKWLPAISLYNLAPF
jgi:hypothetical protein